jgi:hypothetical protein
VLRVRAQLHQLRRLRLDKAEQPAGHLVVLGADGEPQPDPEALSLRGGAWASPPPLGEQEGLTAPGNPSSLQPG